MSTLDIHGEQANAGDSRDAFAKSAPYRSRGRGPLVLASANDATDLRKLISGYVK